MAVGIYGLNDYLVVHGDSLDHIISFEVKDRMENLVMQQSDIPYSNGVLWNGKIDGTVRKGLYRLNIILRATNGAIRTFETEVCNYPCGLPEEGDKISIEGCRFPSEWKCWHFIDGCLYHEYADCFK